MLSDEVRLRISQIHYAQNFGAQMDRPAVHQSWLRLNSSSTPIVQSAIRELPEASDTDYLASGEEQQNESGRHLRFCRPVAELNPTEDRFGMPPRLAETSDVHSELAAVLAHFPRETLFLDLETCGFAGSPVFLVGLVWKNDRDLILDQLFARNYAEERAVLETLWNVVKCNKVLVTFNGKSFDWPMVRDRSTRHRLKHGERGKSRVESARTATDASPPPARLDAEHELVHCDLLHHARRRWKHWLPNCRLQTLERYICRRVRRGDIAGAQVPLAYHDYVRGGGSQQISAILRHNALDLFTLLQLTLHLLAA